MLLTPSHQFPVLSLHIQCTGATTQLQQSANSHTHIRSILRSHPVRPMQSTSPTARLDLIRSYCSYAQGRNKRLRSSRVLHSTPFATTSHHAAARQPCSQRRPEPAHQEPVPAHASRSVHSSPCRHAVAFRPNPSPPQPAQTPVVCLIAAPAPIRGPWSPLHLGARPLYRMSQLLVVQPYILSQSDRRMGLLGSESESSPPFSASLSLPLLLSLSLPLLLLPDESLSLLRRFLLFLLFFCESI